MTLRLAKIEFQRKSYAHLKFEKKNRYCAVWKHQFLTKI